MPLPAHGGEVYGVSSSQMDFYKGDRLLSEWRVDEARAHVKGLLAQKPGDPSVRLLSAHVSFLEGRYAETLAAFDALGVSGPFRDLVRDTLDATKGMVSRRSAHFEVFWKNPKDEILADDALEALEKAQATLSASLGFAPESIVRVEIYPSSADFIKVSTLTREEVETSGTIGLCKFNRLMITSPRVTAWGYPWRDTLCHEYAHLVVYRLTRGRAPIWAHEALAKYYEGAWRGREGRMEPIDLALLSKRFKEDKLVTLEQMSPSIAKLPSSEDAATAFAEVGTMAAFLVERKGKDALKDFLAAMGEGLTDRKALESVWGDTFASFDAAWRGWVKTLPEERADIEIVGVELAEGHEAKPEPGTVRDPQARDFSRLGDMLRERGRVKAAAAEYEKAFRLAPLSAPIASRHALGQIALGRYAEALSALEGVLDLYADRGVLWARKGEALNGLGRHAEARAAYRELMEINPFDLTGRMGLLVAAQKLGDEEEAKREREVLKLLGGEGGMPEGHGK